MLAALAIHHGAAHTEIIIDGETQQPVLVETASRLMGCYNQAYSTAVMTSQAVMLFTKRPTTAGLPIQQPAPGTLQAKL